MKTKNNTPNKNKRKETQSPVIKAGIHSKAVEVTYIPILLHLSPSRTLPTLQIRGRSLCDATQGNMCLLLRSRDNDDSSHIITKTYLYNFDPLKPHFYIVKLGFTGVNIIFHISAQNIDCGYSLEPPRRGGSNEYPQSMF